MTSIQFRLVMTNISLIKTELQLRLCVNLINFTVDS